MQLGANNMSYRRLNVVGGGSASVTIAPWEHPVVWEFVGKGRYLQAAVCRSAARLYSAKFGTLTSKSLSNIAAEGASIILLEWNKEIGCCWDESVFRSGAKGGSVDVLKFLRFNECPIPRDATLCRIAGAGGHLAALDFLRQTCSCVWDKKFCKAASTEGRLEILQYAHAQYPQCRESDNPGWDSYEVCRIAARMGHIHILEWAHKTLNEDGLFDAKTCRSAAYGGALAVLQYLRGVGCDWDEGTCWAAIRNGRVDVLEWAVDRGCPWDVNERISFGQTALHCAKNVEVIEFLVSRGADINDVDNGGYTPVYRATLDGRLEAIKTLVRLGADVNIADGGGFTPLDWAITGGNLEVVEVLRVAGARESA